MYLKITDSELRFSKYFLDFLNRLISGKSQVADWHDQLEEKLTQTDGEIERSANEISPRVFDHPISKHAVHDAYELLHALLTGVDSKFESYRRRFNFIFVVGAPRHGGSYLTKQLFRCLGLDPEKIPDVIAHDGFPDVRPLRFGRNFNSASITFHTLAEYLVMAELYFGGSEQREGKIIVPKKATRFAYQGAFFHDIFGSSAEYVITLRHPIPACISTYEKSGGLPSDEKFCIRSRIEEWVAATSRSLDRSQCVTDLTYFDAYLRYWEHYHHQLAMMGLGAARNWRVVAYGQERMMGIAGEFFERFDCSSEVEQFHVFAKQEMHRDWQAKSNAAIRRVQAVWEAVGLSYPATEIMEQW